MREADVLALKSQRQENDKTIGFLICGDTTAVPTTITQEVSLISRDGGTRYGP